MKPSSDANFRTERRRTPGQEPTILIPGLPAPALEMAPIQVTRLFSPDVIDLDDLAESVRMLLGRRGESRSDSRGPSNGDLLSSATRVSHVLEANEAP